MSAVTPTSPSAPAAHDPQPRESGVQLHVRQRRAFQVHAIVFAVSMVFIAFTNLAINAAAGITGEWWAWWSILALVGWGLGVTIHGLAVRLSRPARLGAA